MHYLKTRRVKKINTYELCKKVNMSSDSDTGALIGGGYIKLHNRKKFSQCKRKTETLASQQGYKRFLICLISVSSEWELETIWATVETETNPVKQKQDKINFLNQKGESKLNKSAYFMFVMELPAYFLKELEMNIRTTPARCLKLFVTNMIRETTINF